MAPSGIALLPSHNDNFGVADFMYENDFFYAETPVPDVKFHVWNIQIHTSIQQRHNFLCQPT